MPDRPLQEQASMPIELYQSFFHAAFEIIGLVGFDGTLLEVNQTALEFANVNRERVIGLPFWETPFWSKSNELRTWLQAAFVTALQGDLQRQLITLSRNDGREAIVDFSIKPLLNTAGKISCLIIEGRDVTEIERLRSELLIKEQQLAFALESAQVIAFNRLASEPGLRLSSDASELFGLAPGSFDGSFAQMTDRIHPDDRDMVQAAFQGSQGADLFSVEYRVILPDDKHRWLRSRIRQELRPDGTVIATAGVLLDITREKEREAEREHLLERVANERTRLEAILAQMPFGVIVMDAATKRFSYVNPQIERLLGTTLEPGIAFENVPVKISRHGSAKPRKDMSLFRAIDEGIVTQATEDEIELSDGQRRLIRSSTSPVRDRLGRIIAAVSLVEDITEQRPTHLFTQELAAELGRARDRFHFFEGEQITAASFIDHLGDAFHQTGLARLEGRLVGLLLISPDAITLAAAAQSLGVTKVAISKVTNEMLERGDLTMSREFSTRAHTFHLTDRAYLRDLMNRRATSWTVAALIQQLIESETMLEPKAVAQLQVQLELYARTAVNLERVLAPLERHQTLAFEAHLEQDWDAIRPVGRDPNSD
jgi:PAS domain S-box-containing protein